MAEDSVDLPATQGVINSSGVELSDSIAKASSGNVEELIVPHYRRASIASCHDFCKYGRKHGFEAKKRHSMTNVVTESPLCGISEVDVGETKTSVTRYRASVYSKLTNKSSVIKPNKSVNTNPMKRTLVVKFKESVNSEIPMSNTPASKEMPKKLPNSQKQVKKEVPVNKKKTSLIKTKPLIHPKSHTSSSPRTIRPVNSSESLKVENSSKSNVEPVENSLRSTMEPVETSSGSTTELMESSSTSTAEPVQTPRSTADSVETPSNSTVELVEVSSKSTAKRVGASLKSAAKRVETSSKSPAKRVEASSSSSAKRVEASSNSSAKMVETPSKSSAKRTEASPRSSAKKFEAPLKSSAKRVEASLKSSAKRVEASSKSTVKKVESSPKSMDKKVETSSSKSTVKNVETSPKSTVKKAVASSKSNSKVGASSKPTLLKAKQMNLSEKPVTSLKSSSVTVKKISSMNPSEGSSGQRNSKPETEKRAVSSKVVARKLITSSRASLPLKSSLHRVASINARKQKSLKIASHLKNQLKTRKDECKKPSKNEVEENNSCVTKMESGNKTLQSDQDVSHDEMSPPQSLSPPQFSSSSQEDQEGSEYTTSETEEDSSSVNLEGEHMENGEALDVKVTGKPSKAGIVCSDKDKGKNMSKLKLQRGKLVELQSDKSSPRKLKFRRAALVGESVKVKAENSKRSFKRRFEAGIDRIGTTVGSEKVVLRRRGVQHKRNAQGLFNLVIEETATKLAHVQKSKVKALVSAFETVISLQERKRPVKSIN